MTLAIGSLCSGYGGLDLAVESALGARTAWVSDIDKGACKVLAHRFPHAPNIGDMTTVDWAAVEPVDVITGGTPCQDLSHAGKRAGMTEGTRSNLWVAMREAIATIRPSLVIWENVGGAYSAAADSEMERREGRLGDRPGRPALRALGRVLGDLASLGYVGGWHGLRAADVGAPHGRLRVFVVAVPAADAGRFAREVPAGWRLSAVEEPAGDGGARRALLPTPRATDGTKGGPNQRGSSGDLMLPSAVALLPTPTTTQRGSDARHSQREGAGPNLHNSIALLPTPTAASDGNTPETHLARKPGRNQVTNLEVMARGGLLPTPSVADVEGGRKHRSGERSRELLLNGIAHEQQWGQYVAAIARWESVVGPAPAPTQRDWEKWEKRKASRLGSTLPVGMRGSIRFIIDGPTPRLSPRFTEWMMGLPAGWITDIPDVTRNEALKLCGNGVVPQQAEAAIRFLLPLIGRAAA